MFFVIKIFFFYKNKKIFLILNKKKKKKKIKKKIYKMYSIYKNKNFKFGNIIKFLIKNLDLLKNKSIIFSGYHDKFPFHIVKNKFFKIHLQKFQYKKKFYKKNFKNILYDKDLNLKKFLFQKINLIIYFWTKNKIENYYQMKKIFHYTKINTKIWVLGEKKSGINSVKFFFKKNIKFKKYKYGSKCFLYQGYLKKKINFIKKKYYKIHKYENFKFKFLPGMFGYKKIDNASKFFVKTKKFKKKYKKILDIAAGSGFLLISLSNSFLYKKIFFSDNCYTSVSCIKKNLKLNFLKGKVIISDIFSNIFEKFDLIISNPPTHENLRFSLKNVIKIIKKSKKYLNKNGELRIISNSSLSYSKYLKKTFKNYKIIKKNKNFKIYQSFKK